MDFYGKYYDLFDSGRSALRFLGSKIKHKVVLLPNYICDSVILPFKQLNYEIRFYDIDINLKPVVNKIHSKDIGIFIHMGYFGFNTNKDLKKIIDFMRKSGVLIVEDITHSFLSKNKHNFLSDYYLVSLRKWFGIYDGGFTHF